MQNVKVLWGTIALLLLAVFVLASLLMARSLKPWNDGNNQDQTQQKADARIIATIGEKTITRSNLEEQLMNKYGRDLLNQMIDHEVVRMEGAARGVIVSDGEIQQEIKRMQQGYDSEAQFYSAMKEQLGFTPETLKKDVQDKLLMEKIAIQGIRVTDDQVNTYVKDHPDEFRKPAQLRLQQIVTGSKDQATRALNDLAKGTDFAQVAKDRSLDDVTRKSGGDLGWVDEDDPFVPVSIMKAAKQLKPGETSKPIEEGGQFFILRLKERKEELKAEEGAVKEQVRKELALRMAPSIKDIVKQLREKWKVSVLQTF
ncbi:peptidyl-prolyl cis-trans isomerase [Paenibacillus cremeus]|uniref:peptidylprolyl isomerase n=1 Tax=Paenibacillus cremeus TaxID=2163881 RepID=A0A559K3R2_9BACL|nr:peptidyl-prolyl cis-trans isomerase [Paenibacillus cremeus]TVY06778.1 peptidylprolyl isomerase [Paenibacillus cremeus]